MNELRSGRSESAGIEVTVAPDAATATARCLACGHSWTPKTRRGRLAAGWHLCPAGCNANKLMADPDVTFSALTVDKAALLGGLSARR